MKPEDWERIGELFDELVRRDSTEREELLSSLDEEDVADELRGLLAAHDRGGRLDDVEEYLTGPLPRGPVRLAAGDVLGHYRILEHIAAGGMSIVYRAEDLRHGREVAVKVLRPELAALLGADRFLQEMRTTAGLQHPNILPLFDSGEVAGLLYYVMPYVEGETLRERLDRETQLPVEDAVRIAVEVADALDYAHRHGVIHRDIKPENILLSEGRPLVADFGIALAADVVAQNRTTAAGYAIGTPQYMSPEQGTGRRTLTGRADIYSLGCVLYEMLVGEPPLARPSSEGVIGTVTAGDSRTVNELRESVPPNVVAVVAKSLQRLPADRFASARAFADALQDPSFTTAAVRSASGDTSSLRRARRLTATLVTIAVTTTLVGGWGWLRAISPATRHEVVEFDLAPPDSTMLFRGLALSPDGRRLVCEVETDRGSVLYQRMIDSRSWEIIPGTEGARDPFFSPDGKSLAFYSRRDRALKRVPLAGGAAHTIAIVDWGSGGTWGPDNVIVYSGMDHGTGIETPGLFRVSADGGTPERLTTPDLSQHEAAHLEPRYVPGSGEVLFTILDVPATPTVAALSLASGKVVRLAPGISPHAYSGDRVTYVTSERQLVATGLDPHTFALEEKPRSIVEDVAIRATTAAYAVSLDGSLAYLSAPAQNAQLVLVDRDGEARPLFSAGVGTNVSGPRFSPSGDRIAFVRNSEIWVYSVVQGTAQRLSRERFAEDPAWTHDGRSIGYSAPCEDGGRACIFLRAADGTGNAREIARGGGDLWQADFAPGDSEVVFFSLDDSRQAPFVFRASLRDSSSAVPLITTEDYVEQATISPDGHWLAYKSRASGSEEVYVRSYPDMGPPVVVSINGGLAPAWSADGRVLYYLDISNGRSWIVAATLRFDASRIEVTARNDVLRAGTFRSAWTRNYDLNPNGREFVMVGSPQTRVVWRVDALAEGK